MPYTPVGMEDLSAGYRANSVSLENERHNREAEALGERNRMTEAAIHAGDQSIRMEQMRQHAELQRRKEIDALLTDMRRPGALLDPAQREAFKARATALGLDFGSMNPQAPS